MERIDDLQYKGLRILQNDTGGTFNADAVLLANFFRAKEGEPAVDLLSGIGVIALLAAAKTGASFCGVELQETLCELANRSAVMNGQDIRFYCMDALEAPAFFGHGRFMRAVMNPPYFQTGEQSPVPARAAARHEKTPLSELLNAAFLLLNNGGSLFLCYPAKQLTDVLARLRTARLEPKRLCLTVQGEQARLALIEAKKLGHPGLTEIFTVAQ